MPQNPPERLSDFARRLLRHETENHGAGGDVSAGFLRVCRALHERLAPLISSTGHQTLFARALKLAARDFPILSTVRVRHEHGCVLEGLPDMVDPQDRMALADACTAALAHFISLLILFIGENLALGKVSEVWPDVPVHPVARTNPSSGAST